MSIFTQKKKIDQTMVVIDEKLFVRAHSLSHRGMWEFEYREQRYFRASLTAVQILLEFSRSRLRPDTHVRTNHKCRLSITSHQLPALRQISTLKELSTPSSNTSIVPSIVSLSIAVTKIVAGNLLQRTQINRLSDRSLSTRKCIQLYDKSPKRNIFHYEI